ncbi:T9SS type A sorting domain-containing protein [Flavobacterium sp.]|uniref:T9SS type A sorting domain-containing protein n=1 Tax=Flavobacterium sp. TaxID=239 RepID=UPI002B4B217F|nr:T9SS type A sorting domain-containing protein [Flavobacterium sp.]HLP65069.1 T9SS type A sorting domain-containing protein [Flavobacterium sp.]
MLRIIKIALIYSILLFALSASAQLNEYIESENNRVLVSNQTEIEIENFIKANFSSYKLSKEITDELIEHLMHEEHFTQLELEAAMINAKKHELRKLFFVRNPEKKNSYISSPIPSSIAQNCVNGDFESGTVGYSFWSDNHPQPQSGVDFFLSCATPTALTATNVINPTTNNFNSRATVINSTANNYQQFDPILTNFNVNMPTLNTNGGTRCIKLNNTGGFGSSDQTTVSRYFPVINQSTIDFNFSLIMDNKPQHGQDIQPFFRARVRDQNGNIVDEICIIANPENCLFNVISVNEERRVLYTGWICARLNVGEILNQPGTIEFTVSDCQPSAHFGTVYIDNICGFVCATPQLGALNIDPTHFNCPDVINNVPMEVCGTYSPPVNATLSSIVLDIVQNGTVIGTVNVPSQLTANSFCFTVLPSLFGADPTGEFEFQVHANFNVNCPAGLFVYEISDNSSGIGPDVTFIDCCMPTLVLTSPSDDHNNLAPVAICQRERSDWIKASNVISFGNNALANGVVYHAENFVELNPGFEAVEGAQFAAYPEGCSGSYVYREDEQVSPIQASPNIDDVNLIKKLKGFAIIPNPSSNFIEIVTKGTVFTKLTITSIDGKVVFEQSSDATDKMKVQISNYEKGVYIITIDTDDGESMSEKLIKN